MSQEKAQLIAPIGIMTVSGMTATGVITATSFTGNIVGSAKSLVNGTDVTAGVVTGTSFVGNLTGNIQRLADSAPNINVGVTTATSFVGNLTGSVTDLTSQPAITVGLVTATSLSGPITGNVTGDVNGDVTGNVTGTISGNVTGNVTGNATGIAGGLGVNYNGGWTGAGTSQVRVGVITATSFHGDGSNLDGVSSGPVSQQAVTADGATTAIDLSSGNLIYMTQSASTTVSFANTENGNVYIVRTKDDTYTARTITWPDRINWDGGSAPTLIQINPRSNDAQVFLLVTRDMGVTWYGKEVVNFDPQTFNMFQMGSNTYGELGQNDRTARSSPTQVSGVWKMASFMGGDYLVAASGVKKGGTGWMWGHNERGNLGLNTLGDDRSSPTQLSGSWSSISLSEYRSYGVKTNDTLWSWGFSDRGQLGLNQGGNLFISSPTQIPGSWSDGGPITTNSAFGIKTDGTMWVWGRTNYGQLGLNQTGGNPAMISSPTQLPGTGWTNKIAGYDDAANLLKSDGTLWAMGGGGSGQLGLNNQTNYSSPTQVGTDTTWKDIASARGGGIATKTDGTLWAWGNNQEGPLGQNSTTSYSSPKQIGTDTTWDVPLVMSRESAMAVKTDGTLWTWGLNVSGALGQNNEVKYSSPTQVPGSYTAGDVRGLMSNSSTSACPIVPRPAN